MATYTCNVNRVGPAADGAETPTPVVYIMLTDTGGSWPGGYWFYAAENTKNEMLAVGLAAISLQKQVAVAVDAPNANNKPYTQCYRLYLVA